MAIFPITKLPFTIPGLITWLDAANVSSITSSAGAVSQWGDNSGMKQIVAQGTANKQPITNSIALNGLNVISFPSLGNKVLGFNNNGAPILGSIGGGNATIFMVSKSIGSPGITTPQIFRMSLAGSTKFALQENNTSNSMTFWWGSTISVSFTTNTWNLFTCYREGANKGISVNGGAYTTDAGATNFTVDGGAIGSGSTTPINPWGGQIAEIIVYKRKLSDAEIATINTYLKNKWGLA